jgi:hypothetical protein
MTPEEARFKMALEAILCLPVDGFYVGAKNIAQAALEIADGANPRR